MPYINCIIRIQSCNCYMRYFSHAKKQTITHDMELAYRRMALEEEREQEAMAWSEGIIGDLKAVF